MINTTLEEINLKDAQSNLTNATGQLVDQANAMYLCAIAQSLHVIASVQLDKWKKRNK